MSGLRSGFRDRLRRHIRRLWLRCTCALSAWRIRRTGLFDRDWYLQHCDCSALSDLDPAVHYVAFGARAGCDPHPLFHSAFYLAANPDVARAGKNPLLHYCRFGAFEGRDPNPFFDTEWYLSQNPDVAARRENPLRHYLQVGAAQGRDPSSLFDTDWYLQMNPDVAASGTNPLVHYVCEGHAQGLLTSPKVGPRRSDAPSDPDPDTGGASPLRHEMPPTEGVDQNALRAAVQNGIERASTAAPSPFYAVLGKVVADGDPAMLMEVERTLNTIDLVRIGKSPPAGPRVSIIMPVFNRRTVVCEAIDSVLAQSYRNFELIVCDDGSRDGSADAVEAYRDPRIRLIRLKDNCGAAAARNRCLEAATGTYIAYLDSDNLWHPHYLAVMLDALRGAPGQPLAYASYFDVTLGEDGYRLRRARRRGFSYRLQVESPFIDLNSLVHHRVLYHQFGGFDERLRRLQDYDLIARYAWCRDPQHVPFALNIYRRIPGLGQISETSRHHAESQRVVRAKIASYHTRGLGAGIPHWVRKVTVLSWDMSRNHFAKAYAVAEALSKEREVELVSFRFFEEKMFRPLAERRTGFQIKAFSGRQFPRFFSDLTQALGAISGDVIYAVKPRLPSLGLALLANRQRGIPVLLEANDLETVIEAPKATDAHQTLDPEGFLARAAEAKSPYAAVWSQLLDPMAAELPILFTHNRNLNEHYRSKCLYMRNIKDESVFDPARYDRAAIRRSLGLGANDRMILFGGLVRRHKGVMDLARWIELRNDPHLKLFVVGSQGSQELPRLAASASASVTVLPAQPSDTMAEINLAADAVVLWLDPKVPASHYQMPYKFTDAIAMGTPVIASPVSDLEALSDIVWHVSYGDFSALASTLQRIFSDSPERARRCAEGRKLFQKEFSYRAARENFALACAMIEDRGAIYPVAETFADVLCRFADRFHAGEKLRRLVMTERQPFAQSMQAPVEPATGLPE